MDNLAFAEKTNEELFDMYRESQDRAVKQELTMRYVYIVKAVAYQMRDMYSDFMQVEDIVNEGVIEIMKAIERYDFTKDNKFETFISRRIRGMVIDMIRKNDWLPRNFHKDSRNMEAATATLTEKLGRQPTEAELSEYLKIDVRKLHRLRRMSTMVNVLSLDMTYDESEQLLLQIPTEDVTAQPERNFLRKENFRLLTEAIEKLQEKEKLVISLYYVEELNMNQIAEILEVSQPRVSQLHSTAVRKLRKYMLNQE